MILPRKWNLHKILIRPVRLCVCTFDAIKAYLSEYFIKHSKHIAQLDANLNEIRIQNEELKIQLSEAGAVYNELKESSIEAERIHAECENVIKDLLEKNSIVKNENLSLIEELSTEKLKYGELFISHGIGDNLQKQLDDVNNELYIAKETIALKTAEVSELTEKLSESIYCEHVGYYCTPFDKTVWR